MRTASLGLVTLLNAVLRSKLPAELFERLAGREIAVQVRGSPVGASFRIRGRHFVPMRPTASPYLRFIASARDFALLAAREEDADTLFFNRRLVVEGDTEAALLVKNSLDCVDAPLLRGLLRRAARLAR